MAMCLICMLVRRNIRSTRPMSRLPACAVSPGQCCYGLRFLWYQILKINDYIK